MKESLLSSMVFTTTKNRRKFRLTKNQLNSKRLVTACLLVVQLFVYLLAIDLIIDGALFIPVFVLIENIAITIFTIKTQIDAEREYRDND